MVAPPRDPAVGRARASDRATGARPRVAPSAQPLLARARRGPGQRGPGLLHQRGGHPSWRRSPHPHLPRLRSGGRLPRPPRAGHAGHPPARLEPRIRDRDARRPDARRDPGGRLGAAVGRATGCPRHPPRTVAQDRPRRRPGRLGRRLAARGSPAPGRGAARRGVTAGAAHGHPGRRPVRVRGMALPAAAARTAAPAAVHGRDGPHPSGRGDGHRDLQPRLASLVVGVAPPHGGCLRLRCHRRAGRVRARAVTDRCVRRSVPGGHPGAGEPVARRCALRPGIGACGRPTDRPGPAQAAPGWRDDGGARPARTRQRRAPSGRRAVPPVRSVPVRRSRAQRSQRGFSRQRRRARGQRAVRRPVRASPRSASGTLRPRSSTCSTPCGARRCRPSARRTG